MGIYDNVPTLSDMLSAVGELTDGFIDEYLRVNEDACEEKAKRPSEQHSK